MSKYWLKILSYFFFFSLFCLSLSRLRTQFNVLAVIHIKRVEICLKAFQGWVAMPMEELSSMKWIFCIFKHSRHKSFDRTYTHTHTQISNLYIFILLFIRYFVSLSCTTWSLCIINVDERSVHYHYFYSIRSPFYSYTKVNLLLNSSFPLPFSLSLSLDSFLFSFHYKRLLMHSFAFSLSTSNIMHIIAWKKEWTL